MSTMNERRAMFEVLTILWPGYSISWAYDATAEIAAYVDHDTPLHNNHFQPELVLAKDTTHLHHLLTVVGADTTLRGWPLRWGSSAAWHGPQLLEKLPGPGQTALKLGILPESGIHVQKAASTLTYLKRHWGFG